MGFDFLLFFGVNLRDVFILDVKFFFIKAPFIQTLHGVEFGNTGILFCVVRLLKVRMGLDV